MVLRSSCGLCGRSSQGMSYPPALSGTDPPRSARRHRGWHPAGDGEDYAAPAIEVPIDSEAAQREPAEGPSRPSKCKAASASLPVRVSSGCVANRMLTDRLLGEERAWSDHIDSSVSVLSTGIGDSLKRIVVVGMWRGSGGEGRAAGNVLGGFRAMHGRRRRLRTGCRPLRWSPRGWRHRTRDDRSRRRSRPARY